jgi:bifunctional UDP-N-acetylglucosamine pyrophosphorylase/glucosamine-1-phosphate N-acetyltransferase
MSPIHVLILAAGKGTRMKSARPKVLHQVAGAPMIDYVLETAAALGAATRTVVVGHEAAGAAAHADLRFVLQEPNWNAHVVQQAVPVCRRRDAGPASGDAPLTVDTPPALPRATRRRRRRHNPHRLVSNPFGTAASSATATRSPASSSADVTLVEREIHEIKPHLRVRPRAAVPSLARRATTRRRSSTSRTWWRSAAARGGRCWR